MSHAATNWAIRQRGLKPAVRVVLWQLADHHNPERGCFPSQETLADECEMSVRSVRDHLGALEAAGLIRRLRGGRRASDRYLFPFEDKFACAQGKSQIDETEPAEAEISSAEPRGTGSDTAKIAAVGTADAGKLAQSSPAKPRHQARQNLPPNPVKEPVRETCVGAASAAHTSNCFEDFWAVYPRPRNRDGCRLAFERLAADGTDLGQIVSAAQRYASENTGNKPMYLAYADNWLRDQRWLDFVGGPAEKASGVRASLHQIALFWAEKIKGGAYVPPSAISPELAATMLSLGLVETGQLARLGLT